MKNLILCFLLLVCFYSFAQEQKKDTLFIKYDNSLLTKYTEPIDKYSYYLIKGTGYKEDIVSLEEEKTYTNLKAKSVLCLKSVLKKSNAYYENNKLLDWKLVEYLGEYMIFLVKDKKYIKVQVVHEIE